MKTLHLSIRGDPEIDLESDAVFFDEGGGTGDYNDLANKPSINGRELVGDSSFEALGLFEQVYSKDEVVDEVSGEIGDAVRDETARQVEEALEESEFTNEELADLLKD